MGLTHFDEDGNARMVDVSEKEDTKRMAIAKGKILVSKEIFDRVKEGKVEKGDVLSVATTSGIMGAKQTSGIIPMCHIIPLTNVEISWDMGEDEEGKHFISCEACVKCVGKTGVEMEALTAVSTALLTVYDMCKAIDKKMVITEIYLKEKSGGKSGHIVNE